MRRLLVGLVFLYLTGCASMSISTSSPDLNNYGPAPELTNTVWLNIDHPLRLADLHGKVVLLDMWTFD